MYHITGKSCGGQAPYPPSRYAYGYSVADTRKRLQLTLTFLCPTETSILELM